MDKLLDLNGLKADPKLVARIDWDLTPQEAFHTYQLKSPDNRRGGGLSPAYYFYVSAWAGAEPRLFLVRRELKNSEELAEIAAPEELLAAAVAAQEGAMVPKGQAALTPELKDWLQRALSS
jgi:hypothetical protein